jgi:hypothetical protein
MQMEDQSWMYQLDDVLTHFKGVLSHPVLRPKSNVHRIYAPDQVVTQEYIVLLQKD